MSVIHARPAPRFSDEEIAKAFAGAETITGENGKQYTARVSGAKVLVVLAPSEKE